jgi:UDP-N-acetylmuramyl pentapeptide phosphotransferase/UDP-N-acetylglucosamine-1-phosphate transferase
VHALPTLVALAAALLLTPPILRHLQAEGFTRENYRGVRLPFPGGIAIVAAAVLAVGLCSALVAIAELDLFGIAAPIDLTYPLGVALLGLVDDLLAGISRGWRGHGRAVLAGEFSTGALKAVGSLALALYLLDGTALGEGVPEYLLAVALLVLTTNLFNLLDLRPGRSAKAFLLLGVLLSLVAWHGRFDEFEEIIPLWIVGPLAAPILVIGFYDLKERTMLGDVGSNVIGAVAGLWLLYAFNTTGQLIALAIVLALTVYGELRSLNTLIERTPLLRQIDSIGRNDAHA